MYLLDVEKLLRSEATLPRSRFVVAFSVISLNSCADSELTDTPQSLTRLLFLLAAPLRSSIKYHLLHLVQLLLQTGKMEVCTLLCHRCKVYKDANT